MIVRPTAVLIVGHTQCGGADTSLKVARKEKSLPPGPLGHWLAPLIALAESLKLQQADPDALLKVIEANVRAQVTHVADSAPVQAEWQKREKVWVYGFVYELENGKLRDLNVTRSLPPK